MYAHEIAFRVGELLFLSECGPKRLEHADAECTLVEYFCVSNGVREE